MKLKEEKELQTITGEYEKALRLFHKKNVKSKLKKYFSASLRPFIISFLF